ncbi:MAG: hypothetical protein H5T64_02120 [Chloroflexi bacterium]|nr:hypothetical protein [Chloroflexota bacterium]
MTRIVWLGAGLFIGAISTLSLHWQITNLRPNQPRSAAVWVVGAMLLRLAMTAALLGWALSKGIIPMLVAACGWTLGRLAMIGWAEFSRSRRGT